MNYSDVSEIARGEVLSLIGRHRVSVRATADGAGIPLSTLNRRLTGRSSFTIDEIDRLARYFGVKPVSLLHDSRVGDVA